LTKKSRLKPDAPEFIPAATSTDFTTYGSLPASKVGEGYVKENNAALMPRRKTIQLHYTSVEKAEDKPV
jgi:hypothetical protein